MLNSFKVRSRLVISVAVALVTAVPSVSAESAAGPKELYNAAKKEGIVTIWAINAEDVNWIQSYFGKDYPGIAIRVFTDLNIAARLITEDRAGRHDSDVVWNSEALVAPLIERGLVEKPEWLALRVRKEDIGAGGYMGITSSVTYVVAYNKKLVRAEDAPQRWTDLLKPAYRGKMTSSPFLMARLCAALAVYQGEEVMADFARKLRADANVLWSNDLSEQLVSSGERSYVVATANHFAYRWIAKGLPVGYSVPEPVFITQFGGVIMKNAPHPNAARLLVAWMASPAGKKAREEAIFAVDLRPESGHPKALELRNSGKEIHFDDLISMEKRNSLIPKMDRVLNGLN
jgi:ABC-type Fe3+ transport system substrate-binding protein